MSLYKWKGIPILMYHYLGVSPKKEDVPYYVEADAFYNQMRFLRVAGYKSITLDQLLGYFKGKEKIPRRSVVITFDDGHASFERLGMPILERFGYTATMFVITSKVGEPGYLTRESIVSMREKGFQFESHSHTHPILTKIAEGETRYEVFESKKQLESVLGEQVRFFAYRGGHFNKKIQEVLREAGYDAAVCSKPGLNTVAEDCYALRRMGIRGDDDLGKFARKLLGLTVYRNSVAYLIHALRI